MDTQLPLESCAPTNDDLVRDTVLILFDKTCTSICIRIKRIGDPVPAKARVVLNENGLVVCIVSTPNKKFLKNKQFHQSLAFNEKEPIRLIHSDTRYTLIYNILGDVDLGILPGDNELEKERDRVLVIPIKWGHVVTTQKEWEGCTSI